MKHVCVFNLTEMGNYNLFMYNLLKKQKIKEIIDYEK